MRELGENSMRDRREMRRDKERPQHVGGWGECEESGESVDRMRTHKTDPLGIITFSP